MLSIEKLENIVTELKCTCSPDQQTGIDSSLCKSCQAAKCLNAINEIAKFELEMIKKESS
jgi:hypothetical protein